MQKLAFAITVGLFVSAGVQAKEGPGPGEATVKGPLGKEVIRDVILKHVEEVRRCYEAELDKNKDLAGKLMVSFTIGTDGKVTESKLDQTTVRNEIVEKCAVEAVRSWEFPKPRGGVVKVTYPFLLAASGDETDRSKAANKK